MFNAQPPEVRELLLSTAILEQVNAEAATELAGDEEAGRILRALAHANAFVQPIGGGWYRYHTLFAQILRRRLGRESPARIASLHRQAARWYQRNGRLTDAVRHAAHAGDWQLAADIVIDGLAISEIIEPTGGPSAADELAGMPHGEAWPEPGPHLVCAAVALSTGRLGLAVAGLDAAEDILERLPADHQTAARLAAAMIRLAVARRSGNLTAAAEAATRAEALADTGLRAASSPDTRQSRPACCPLAGPWSCGRATSMRRYASSIRASSPQPHRAVSPNGPPASAISRWPRPCAAGCAAPRCWPSRRQPPARAMGGGRLPSTPTPQHLWHWPGCTWNTMS